jgi:hypothetical protein
VSTLQQHLDFIAILVLAAILGSAQAPRMRARIVHADWQTAHAHGAIIHFSKLIRHISAR